MVHLVEDSDIERSTPKTITVGATADFLSPTRLGKTRRSFFSIIPLTVGVDVTITFGEQTAVANQGLVLGQKQPYLEVMGENFIPFQGAIGVVASGVGSVAFVERYEGD